MGFVAYFDPPPERQAVAPLIVGATNDPLEAAADRAEASPAGPPSTGHVAPAVVRKALGLPGQPLDRAERILFEGRYQHDFSAVRLHTGEVAARSARAIGARAYTVAEHIVLGEDRAEISLLAHELAHVVQQSAASAPWVQRQPAAAAPRKNFVFIMGADKKGTSNPFYNAASQYFHAHLPGATFVEDQRSLAEMLRWIADPSHVADPIGDLYIVSHGNEDGTLQFGLNSLSGGSINVVDLRNALHP